MPNPLRDGLYEHLITEGLERQLGELKDRGCEVGYLEPAEAPVRLARHLATEIELALGSLPAKKGAQLQAELTNDLLTALSRLAPKGSDPGVHVSGDLRELRAIYRSGPPKRPSTPMTSTTLLTRSRDEPNLGAELAREIASADEVDVLVAFITMSGVRALRDELEAFARRAHGITLRVLTTVFTGTTDEHAVQWLARLPGAKVKVSFDTRRTRLHAKAWLFRRHSGLHSAYVGSANLTHTALGSGQEWMIKVCAADLPHVVEKFRGTFDSLWNDSEFEEYDPNSEESRQRLRHGLRAQSNASATVVQFFQLRPFPFQEEILDRLDAERSVNGRNRNLVVAATGTGKTVVSAFDYKRQVDRQGVAPRLLFLAHRQELLEQALATFRQVLRDGSFGELLVGGEGPERWEHVFATIQSAASRELPSRLGPAHFGYVVVDECHHAPADSYQRLLSQLQPEILLGLTATPERSDGKSLLGDFGGHIAAELRIWDALERQLLVPFEYYGIADDVDLNRVRWTRSGYQSAELSRLYTGNEKRVDIIVEQLRRRVADVGQVRALAFCVSVEHAEFMAEALSRRGVPAVSIHGSSNAQQRSEAPRMLRDRECNVVCTCDLYNEGVDLPFVDTLLFLRPTSSATLFLQQLGRGLRHDAQKTSCLVLDFIGRQRAEFRFDGILSALTGISRSRLVAAANDSFPYLPSGCVLQLDAVSRKYVLESLKEHLQKRARLVEQLQEYAQETDVPVTLKSFLDATAREVEDVYGAKSSWTILRRQAGLLETTGDNVEDLSRRLGWLLHVDEPQRFAVWRKVAAGHGTPTSEAEARRYSMLTFQLEHRGALRTPAATALSLSAHNAIGEELTQLADVLEDRTNLPTTVFPVTDWPLALHRHYGRREIMAAIGRATPGEKASTPQGGILKLSERKAELLFVTLDKSHHSFSPTTRYRDYAISPTLFHWESQGAASVEQASGQRYTESPANGWTFHLFVRTTRDAAYAYVGPAERERHEGNRPIAITWRLRYALPASLFSRFATLVQG